MKPGFIYILKTKGGLVAECVFVAKIEDINVMDPLPFYASPLCPRHLKDDEIDWFREICPLSRDLCGRDYTDLLSKLHAK